MIKQLTILAENNIRSVDKAKEKTKTQFLYSKVINEGKKNKAKILKMCKRERYFLPFLVALVLFFLSFCVNGMHFVLVHGGLHGAWCWYKVANKLKSEGHNVTTLDMAACGVNPKQRQEVHSVSEYNEPLMTFMASLPPEEKVILVRVCFLFVTHIFLFMK